jgi:hypothetical protein
MISMRMDMISFLNSRRIIYAKTPFSSSDAPPPPFIRTWELRERKCYVHSLVSDRFDDIQVTKVHPDMDVGKEDNSTTGPDYVIDGVDMRNLGKWSDIVNLFEDRLSKNWNCWPLLESIELRTSIRDQRPINKIKPTIRRIRRDIDVL